MRLDGFDIGFLRRRFRRNESFLRDDGRRAGEEFFDRSLGTLPERTQGMGNVVRLEHHPVVGQGGEFRDDPFRVAGGVWSTVEGEFFTARREAHAEIFFDQLEVPVVVTEQNGGIGAFSQFKFTHACREEPLLYRVVIVTNEENRDNSNPKIELPQNLFSEGDAAREISGFNSRESPVTLPALSRAQSHIIKMRVCGASPLLCPLPPQRPDQATLQDARNGGPNVQATRDPSSA